MSRLKEKYFKKIVPALKKELGYKNDLAVPRMQKVVVNVGLGKAIENKKLLDQAVSDIAAITGQKPVLKSAKKSIAAFKIREGTPVGLMVTLRGERMYEFVDRLVNVAIPRIRDFRGLPETAFDKQGNYSIGIREHIVFPEINTDSVNEIFGLEITIVIKAKNSSEAKRLLILLGFPINPSTSSGQANLKSMHHAKNE